MIDLSTTELDVVWRTAGFGALPLIIDVPSPGATHAERAALECRVWTDLVARGLADDHGRPHWRLADRLETIAQPSRSLQLRIFGADATRAVLATRGRKNVLGVLGDRFHLTPTPASGAAATLLALLPEVPAGREHSVSVDTTAFAAATRATTAGRAHDTLRRHGLDADDGRTLLAMTTGSVRTIQIVAETRDADGRTTRSWPLSVHDTPAGRYRTVRTISATADHLTVTPATTAAIATALAQLTPVSTP
jgi:hypothetical protein